MTQPHNHQAINDYLEDDKERKCENVLTYLQLHFMYWSLRIKQGATVQELEHIIEFGPSLEAQWASCHQQLHPDDPRYSVAE